jgi:3-oxoacyl-[acyl-carrier protein] reductase
MQADAGEASLTERVALVTGGGRGIGAAICRRLAGAGAAVAVNYLEKEPAASQVVRSIEAAGGRAIPLAADVTDAQAVSEIVGRVEEQLGTIDILVNNAWRPRQFDQLERLDWETYQAYVDDIVKAAYNTVRAMAPGMKAKGWGRIINIGTTALYELNEGHTPYVAAKGALLAFTRGLARDLGPSNICVNMVSPGLVYTGYGEPPPDFGKVHAARSPMGRNPTAWEVAGAVLFLASPMADAVTGAHIPVCCGLVMQVG